MFIFGDSHALAIRRAAEARGVTVFGGQFDAGRHLNDAFHTLKPATAEGFDLVFHREAAETAYRRFLAEAGTACLSDLRMPVLCLFGMNVHYLSRGAFWSPFAIDVGGPGQFLSRAVLGETVRAMVPGALQFHRDLVALGFEVYTALPPRRTPNLTTGSLPHVFRALEALLSEAISGLGVRVIDHRPWSLGPDGHLKPEFLHPDPADDVHGSDAFGAGVLEQWIGLALGARRVAERPSPDAPERTRPAEAASDCALPQPAAR